MLQSFSNALEPVPGSVGQNASGIQATPASTVFHDYAHETVRYSHIACFSIAIMSIWCGTGACIALQIARGKPTQLLWSNDCPELGVDLQAASDSRPGDGSAGAELASQVRSAVQEQTGSQHKDLADSAIEAASAALDRKWVVLYFLLLMLLLHPLLPDSNSSGAPAATMLEFVSRIATQGAVLTERSPIPQGGGGGDRWASEALISCSIFSFRASCFLMSL